MTAEARDALAVALAEAGIGAWDDEHIDRALAALPDGWVLARREDAEDGAALALELAWGLIANAGGGDWTTQTPEWQEAAARWRDQHYHPLLAAAARKAKDALGGGS